MPLGRWRKVSESVVFRNPWWTYRLDRFEMPSGGQGEYHYVHTNGSAMVVPIADTGELLLVNQYRYLAERESLEFPCGGVKDGATHEQTARAELAEETGHGASQLDLVGRFNPYSGMTDEMCHVYIARGLYPTQGAEPDETEELELRALSADEVAARIHGGDIWDGMTIAAWHLVTSRLAP
jgi:8-oxo-dGTP pyrophosphatase MutT (NUDIX family)